MLFDHAEAETSIDTEHMLHNVMEVQTHRSDVLLALRSTGRLAGCRVFVWLFPARADGQPIGDKSAEQIFAAADNIYKAGTE